VRLLRFHPRSAGGGRGAERRWLTLP
jgi:hypothetical protein